MPTNIQPLVDTIPVIVVSGMAMSAAEQSRRMAEDRKQRRKNRKKVRRSNRRRFR